MQGTWPSKASASGVRYSKDCLWPSWLFQFSLHVPSCSFPHPLANSGCKPAPREPGDSHQGLPWGRGSASLLLEARKSGGGGWARLPKVPRRPPWASSPPPPPSSPGPQPFLPTPTPAHHLPLTGRGGGGSSLEGEGSSEITPSNPVALHKEKLGPGEVR